MTLIDTNTDNQSYFLTNIKDKVANSYVMKTAEYFITGPKEGVSKTAEQPLFLVPSLNAFPCDSREEALTNIVYYKAQASGLDDFIQKEASANLKLMCKLYDFNPTMFDFKMEKQASELEFESLLPSYGLFKIAEGYDLTIVGADIDLNMGNLTIDQRIEVSKNFLKKVAGNPEIEIPISIAKYAGELSIDKDATAAFINERIRFANENKDVLEKLAEDIMFLDEATVDKEGLNKLASQLLEIDKAEGFTSPYYDTIFPDAYSTVFSKCASLDNILQDRAKSADNEHPLTAAEVLATYGAEALQAVSNPDGSVNQDLIDTYLKKNNNKSFTA